MPDEEGGRAQCLGYSWREAFLGYFLVPLTSALGQARMGISAGDGEIAFCCCFCGGISLLSPPTGVNPAELGRKPAPRGCYGG